MRQALVPLRREGFGRSWPVVFPHSSGGRAGKQPDGSTKTREVKLCTVWSAEARDANGTPVRDEGSVTYSAAIESGATSDPTQRAEFTERVLRETTRRRFCKAERTAVLEDGAAWIWNIAHELFPGSIEIVDRFHAVIRAWLGHVSLDATNRYAEITLRTKQAAVAACLPPAEGPVAQRAARQSGSAGAGSPCLLPCAAYWSINNGPGARIRRWRGGCMWPSSRAVPASKRSTIAPLVDWIRAWCEGWLRSQLGSPADGSLRNFLAKLSCIDVLVIDDWAMAPMADAERRDFREICENRYQTRSTILTTQLPVARWREQIGDPTAADGILDRLVHSAHRVEMRGESMRKKRGAQPSG